MYKDLNNDSQSNLLKPKDHLFIIHILNLEKMKKKL